MKKIWITFLCLILTLSLTGCGYKKPEQYSVAHLAVDSITTFCNTDCSLDNTDVTYSDSNCTATYYYTDVADDKGISDAKSYYDYLVKHSLRVDDFDEASGSYTAYIGGKEDLEGMSVRVAFTKDSYTVTISDNVKLK